jgi:hypothetical protein
MDVEDESDELELAKTLRKRQSDAKAAAAVGASVTPLPHVERPARPSPVVDVKACMCVMSGVYSASSSTEIEDMEACFQPSAVNDPEECIVVSTSVYSALTGNEIENMVDCFKVGQEEVSGAAGIAVDVEDESDELELGKTCSQRQHDATAANPVGDACPEPVTQMMPSTMHPEQTCYSMDPDFVNREHDPNENGPALTPGEVGPAQEPTPSAPPHEQPPLGAPEWMYYHSSQEWTRTEPYPTSEPSPPESPPAEGKDV